MSAGAAASNAIGSRRDFGEIHGRRTRRTISGPGPGPVVAILSADAIRCNAVSRTASGQVARGEIAVVAGIAGHTVCVRYVALARHMPICRVLPAGPVKVTSPWIVFSPAACGAGCGPDAVDVRARDVLSCLDVVVCLLFGGIHGLPRDAAPGHQRGIPAAEPAPLEQRLKSRVFTQGVPARIHGQENQMNVSHHVRSLEPIQRGLVLGKPLMDHRDGVRRHVSLFSLRLQFGNDCASFVAAAHLRQQICTECDGLGITA